MYSSRRRLLPHCSRCLILPWLTLPWFQWCDCHYICSMLDIAVCNDYIAWKGVPLCRVVPAGADSMRPRCCPQATLRWLKTDGWSSNWSKFASTNQFVNHKSIWIWLLAYECVAQVASDWWPIEVWIWICQFEFQWLSLLVAYLSSSTSIDLRCTRSWFFWVFAGGFSMGVTFDPQWAENETLSRWMTARILGWLEYWWICTLTCDLEWHK